MPKPRKKYSKRSSLDKSIDRAVKGFWMRFSVVDPLGDHDKPVNTEVGSTNPVVQVRLRNDNFWQSLKKVLHHKRLKWNIEIRMEFEKDGRTEFKARELVGVGRLYELDEHYQDSIEDMFKDACEKSYIDQYVTTHVVQEVLSGQEIRDGDFSEERGALE